MVFVPCILTEWKTGLTVFKGFTFSPDGEYAYVTDTGINYGFYGMNFTRAASMYVSPQNLY